jgi:hypothetical protein
MSLASVFVLLGFLAFFLLVVPVGIWLFAKFFPRRGSSVFGFPEPDPRDTAAPGARSTGPRIRRTPGPTDPG